MEKNVDFYLHFRGYLTLQERTNMEINEIVLLELEGIAKGIYEYTTDYYIRSYTKKLLDVKYPEDEELLYLLVLRLCDWYSLNIDDIKNGEYILNKDGHDKAYGLLKEMKKQLEDKLERGKEHEE